MSISVRISLSYAEAQRRAAWLRTNACPGANVADLAFGEQKMDFACKGARDIMYTAYYLP